MDLVLFYYFSMLAKYRNFSVAADEVYLSQSSLSKRIKSLEDKLGVELFIRGPRSVELTRAGEALLPYAQNIVGEMDVLKEQMGRLANRDSVLRICASSFLSYYGITTCIADWMNGNPQITVGIKEINSSQGLMSLREGEMDAVLMFHTGSGSGEYDVHPLVADEIVAIMNRDHALAQRKTLSLADLEDQELILISEHDESFFRALLFEALNEAGCRFRLHKYKVWIGAVETILRQSQSLAILPRRVAERMNSGAVVWKPVGGLPQIWFSIIARADNKKVILKDFIHFLGGHAGIARPDPT